MVTTFLVPMVPTGHHAGARRLAVQVHGAGAALGDAAAVLGARHLEHVAQDPQEGHIGSTSTSCTRPFTLSFMRVSGWGWKDDPILSPGGPPIQATEAGNADTADDPPVAAEEATRAREERSSRLRGGQRDHSRTVHPAKRDAAAAIAAPQVEALGSACR
jgi:hypothetical protein